MITTRKTEPEVTVEPRCPLTQRGCLDKTCLWWDEDYHVCGMSPVSVYNQLRDAVTDAAVDIIKTYRRENNG